MAKQKQLSIYDLLDDASDSRPGLPPGETAASPTLHADSETQGSLFDASFQLDVDFTEDSGHLTPSLKVKRNVVEKDFASEIDALYS